MIVLYLFLWVREILELAIIDKKVQTTKCFLIKVNSLIIHTKQIISMKDHTIHFFTYYSLFFELIR